MDRREMTRSGQLQTIYLINVLRVLGIIPLEDSSKVQFSICCFVGRMYWGEVNGH
jgi:hypothetical protein